jgi:phosphoenolpyruvate carboxylase
VDRDQIKFPPKHLALREDVHQLGTLVGEMLREQGGVALYDLVEGDRVAAISRRKDEAQDKDTLRLRVADRPPEVARDLVRAFSTWFQSVNLAERVHRIRRRREYFLVDGGKPQPGGIEDSLATLKHQGMSLAEIVKVLSGLRIEPILVAHPTESARRTQLRRQQRMAGALLERLNPNLDPQEVRNLWARLRTEITTGWQTEEHPRQRLTVADEREHAMFHFAEVLYRIVPTFYEEISSALVKLFGAIAADIDPPRILHFGTWVGGDMEGAEDIHAKSIRETLARQQQVIVNEYFSDCQKLSQLLSQSASRVAVSAALQSRIDEYLVLLPAARSASPSRHDQMPYRIYFAQLGQRLRQTYEGRANRYERVEQFRADLLLAAESLLANRGVSAGYRLVRRLLLRVDTFGFHLATLDLKQRADVHHRVIGQGLDDAQWMQRSPEDRQQRLAQLLERDVGPTAPLDALGRRTLAVFDAALQSRSRFGSRSIGNYIVSATSGADDVLAPLVLARWAGADDRRHGQVGLDFAPLFESAESLRDAGRTMQSLLDNRSYRVHLTERAQPQTVLVGYSQGSRDSGYVAMRLAAFDAQRDLARTLGAAAQPYVICHARGGSIARGGSRIDSLVRSAPAESINGVLQLTEQGETLSQGYGLRPNALRTLERAFGALGGAVAARRTDQDIVKSPALRECIEQVAKQSREVWRALVVEQADFQDFFRAVTPIDVIERMQIGSRSIWETASPGAGAMSIRSTPWVFAWSQARYFIPGWYGAGTALQAAIDSFGVQPLRDGYRDWRLLASIIDDLEAQLARADLDIAEHYVALASVPLRRYGQVLRLEYARCREAVLKIKDELDLLDADRTQQRAIQLRNPYVDPMNLMQVDLLRRWRESGREDQNLFDALLASVSGIAQGLQTTG